MQAFPNLYDLFVWNTNGSFPGNENEFCHHKLQNKPLHLNTLKPHLHIIQNIQITTQKPMVFDVSWGIMSECTHV